MFMREPSNSVPSRRRWLQFSLRTFLVVVTVFGAWLGLRIHRAEKQKRAAETLRALGAVIWYEHQKKQNGSYDANIELDWPAGARELCGDDFFQTVAGLILLRGVDKDSDEVLRAITDADLKCLADLPKLRTLGLGGTSISDAGLAAALKGASSLEVLSLDATQITDAGLALLKDARRLRSLSLKKTEISDAGLIHLRNAKQLRSLNLEETRITDAGLRHLHGLPELERVSLDGTLVTPDGMAALKAATPSIDRRLREIIELGKRQAR